MFESLLLVGCIVFFCIVVYGLQMRQRLNTKYPTGCKVTYYPDKEEILMMPSPSPSSPFVPDPSYRIYDPQNIQGF